ncbi:g1547 [Coccomyxa elongata]
MSGKNHGRNQPGFSGELDMEGERQTLFSQATTSGTSAFEPTTQESLTRIALTGAAFIAVDTVISNGPIYRWMQYHFRRLAAPSVKLAEVDKAVPHISTRIVSSIHILIQIPLAIMVLLSTHLQEDRLYSKSPLTWQLVTTTAGYFLYDFYVHSVRYEYAANLVHAAAALTVFMTGIYCGVLHYYGAMFLLWECSTPFVFIRWVLHTLGRTKDKFYLYNGLTMMAVFFLCRNLLGVGMSLDFWRVSGAELAHPRPGGVPAAALWVIRLLNLVFNFLNILWFSKMLRGAIKVLQKSPASPLEATAEAQVALSESKKKHEE